MFAVRWLTATGAEFARKAIREIGPSLRTHGVGRAILRKRPIGFRFLDFTGPLA